MKVLWKAFSLCSSGSCRKGNGKKGGWELRSRSASYEPGTSAKPEVPNKGQERSSQPRAHIHEGPQIQTCICK